MIVPPSWTKPVVRIMAYAILLVSIVSIGFQLLKWTTTIRWLGMEFDTAITFAIVAMALILICRNEK